MRQQPVLRARHGRGTAGLQVRSRAFEHGHLIPNRYSRQGEDVSPDLQWSRIPPGTAELLLLVEDPDAPHRTVLHWLVTGIDPLCTGLGVGETPKGGKVWCNDFGELGYSGPQLTMRQHRYFFRLFALATPARVPRHPRAADVHRAIRGAVLTSGALLGWYDG